MSSGRILVSSCKWLMFVSSVQPVAVRSAAFWVVWSLFMCVLLVIGAHTVEAYSSMGLVTVLKVFVNVSFCLPHFVDVSAFSMLRVLSAFSFVFSVCLLKVN